MHLQGMAASERALSTYCSLHRLFLALADHHALHSKAAAILSRFMTQSASRHKSQTPNLGWFIPLMALAPDYDSSSEMSQQLTWQAMGPTIMHEALDRNIMWICKHNPALQKSLKVRSCAPALSLRYSLCGGIWHM